MTHHHHDREREVVVERDSSAGLVIGIVVALLVLFLIWAIFFSGWVIDRDEAETPTNIEQREEGDTDIDIIDPGEGDQTDGGTTDDTTNDTTEPTP
jgi:hypothetical protein